eukprot:TRINITY_DN10766_c0_g1_i1.p1 TRINITY_DN10766_c0_g1~~TRINITY_DN10766_c0_g1_i1.p1  ORF type:complete len:138 (-),score=30.96 TRINITY_DN10766_c0_g1_i1:55-468(-)
MTSKLEDIFSVTSTDKAHFDKVTRIEASTEGGDMELVLDVNTDIYPMHEGEKFTLALATSLDANPDPGHWNPNVNSPLLDKYEYVMSGKVFKFVRETSGKLSLYVSFGGLLMKLQGNQKSLQDFELDSTLYLLIRKS